jgi:galactokinase/mevalonate kinase-like predicted kinase
MVVIAIEPTFRFMERSGFCTSTRNVAEKIWKDGIPAKEPWELVEELYYEENKENKEPSGSQDMIGIIYPGINRLDYDYNYKGGLFPVHIESCHDRKIADWLEDVLYIIPVGQRPQGYNPLEKKNLKPEIIQKLGETGKDCFDAIVNKDISKLGNSMNNCMEYWGILMPGIIEHRLIRIDLKVILKYYQSNYSGAMYSGCGGGYLYVVSEKPVPGGISVKIKTGG